MTSLLPLCDLSVTSLWPLRDSLLMQIGVFFHRLQIPTVEINFDFVTSLLKHPRSWYAFCKSWFSWSGKFTASYNSVPISFRTVFVDSGISSRWGCLLGGVVFSVGLSAESLLGGVVFSVGLSSRWGCLLGGVVFLEKVSSLQGRSTQVRIVSIPIYEQSQQ